MLLNLLAYFAVGILIDIFYTIWYIGVTDKNVAQAMIGSLIVTLLSYTLLYYLILSPTFIFNLLAYATGGSLGTGLVMWYKEYRGNNSKTT